MSTPPQSGPWNDPQRWSEPPAGGAPAGGSPVADGSAGEPEPPSTIRFSAILMYVGAALGVIGVLLSFTMTDEIREQIVDQSDTQMTESEIDTLVNVSVAIGVIVGLVGVGLWIWMAIANQRGLSWARIVATVLGGLNIGFTLLGFLMGSAMGQPNNALNIAMQVLVLGLAIIILALLWQPQSTEYYEAVSRHRQQRASPYGY